MKFNKWNELLFQLFAIYNTPPFRAMKCLDIIAQDGVLCLCCKAFSLDIKLVFNKRTTLRYAYSQKMVIYNSK
jgi:hypothetical protein